MSDDTSNGLVDSEFGQGPNLHIEFDGILILYLKILLYRSIIHDFDNWRCFIIF